MYTNATNFPRGRLVYPQVIPFHGHRNAVFGASMSQTTTSGRLPTTRPTALSTWKASRHLSPLPRPPVDPEIDAPPKTGPDGRIIKKVRPRRTIDLWAGVGRWEMVIAEIYVLYALFKHSLD
jgi:hypothetical protein